MDLLCINFTSTVKEKYSNGRKEKKNLSQTPTNQEAKHLVPALWESLKEVERPMRDKKSLI